MSFDGEAAWLTGFVVLVQQDAGQKTQPAEFALEPN